MVFVYLPDGGFRLDLLVCWGPADKEALEAHPDEPVSYYLMIGGVEQRCGTTATLAGLPPALSRHEGLSKNPPRDSMPCGRGPAGLLREV